MSLSYGTTVVYAVRRYAARTCTQTSLPKMNTKDTQLLQYLRKCT